MPFLEIKQLTKSYNARTIVSAIDLTMTEGEILSLLGPSGCGKTTILRMIAGLVTPDSGRIQVGDQVFFDDGRQLPVEERQIGMVFQDFALWPHMTVAQNVAFSMKLRRQPTQHITARVRELLELVNLPGLEDRYPHQLSGGQQQRVALARSLSTAPRVLLLDEPLSSLDTGLRASMRTELVRLFRQLKITTINVTHDQDEAMSMSDRIMLLRDGHIQQIGTPTDLYLDPENTFVAAFMGEANLLPGTLISSTPQANSDLISLKLDHGANAAPIVSGLAGAAVRKKLNGKASLLCRPDDILVHQTEPISGQAVPINLLSGIVLHTSFVAGRWRTLVNVPGHTQPILVAPSVGPHIDQLVWLELPPQHCRIVPA